jgi:GT2 family glycosyltransferase
MPLISIVIPTYRAVDCLILCVKSLAQCELRELMEVCIYGDGGGEEADKAIKQCSLLLEKANVKCHAFYNPQNLGNTPAVNRVAAMATGEWLFFCNDDMVFPKNWLNICMPLLQPNRILSVSCIEPPIAGHAPASCFYAHNLGVDPTNFDTTKLEAFNSTVCQKNMRTEIGVNYPFFVEKNLFEKVGRADERFSGPYHDPDLHLRFRLAGAEMVRTQACALYHFSGMSLRFVAENTGVKKRKNSLSWVRKENQARLLFIEKWGTKPRSRFGEIPRTRAKEPFVWGSAPALAKVSVQLLLAWEKFRIAWRELRYRLSE